MVDTIVVRVPGHPDSPNRIGGASRWKRAQHAAEWRATARICALDALNRAVGRRDSQFPFERARITLVWTYPKRPFRDPDNALASAKPIIDGLIDAGLIAGDTERHVEYGQHEQRVLPGLRLVDIRVERLPAHPDVVPP